MAKKKKESVELRFYDIPQGEQVLALTGERWDRVYGHEESKLHFHNLMEIGICRRGDGALHLDKEIYEYSTGTVSILPENFPHTTISSGEKTDFWEYLFFDPKLVVRELYPDNVIFQHEIVEKLNLSPMAFPREEDEALVELVEIIMRESNRQAPYYRPMIQNYLKNLVMAIMRRHENLSKYGDMPQKNTGVIQIASALDYINKNYAQPMKAKDLADVCSMSETHFRRVFEEYVNMAPMDYVNLVRIQRACEMMKKSDDSMEAIAARSGFATTSTFNRNFKKFLDTSPYQWKINPTNYERKLLNYNISALKGW
jgi:AraC-like DNA-binding protein